MFIKTYHQKGEKTGYTEEKEDIQMGEGRREGRKKGWGNSVSLVNRKEYIVKLQFDATLYCPYWPGLHMTVASV